MKDMVHDYFWCRVCLGAGGINAGSHNYVPCRMCNGTGLNPNYKERINAIQRSHAQIQEGFASFRVKDRPQSEEPQASDSNNAVGEKTGETRKGTQKMTEFTVKFTCQDGIWYYETPEWRSGKYKRFSDVAHAFDVNHVREETTIHMKPVGDYDVSMLDITNEEKQ